MRESGTTFAPQEQKTIHKDTLMSTVMLEHDTGNVLSILALQLRKALESKRSDEKALSVARDVILLQLDLLKLQSSEAKKKHGKGAADFAVASISQWRAENKAALDLAQKRDKPLLGYVESVLRAVEVALIDGSKLEDFDYKTAFAPTAEEKPAEEPMKHTSDALCYSMTGSHVISDKRADVEAKPAAYDDRVSKAAKSCGKDVKMSYGRVKEADCVSSDSLAFPGAVLRVAEDAALVDAASSELIVSAAAGRTAMDVDCDGPKLG